MGCLAIFLQKCLHNLEEWVLNPGPFLFTNQKPIRLSLQFSSILNACTEPIKNGKHHLLKNDRPYYINILPES